MIDALRPLIGTGLGIMLMLNGLRWWWQPHAFVGVGLIPASDPRTVRIFGIGIFIIGLLNAGLNLPQIFSE